MVVVHNPHSRGVESWRSAHKWTPEAARPSKVPEALIAHLLRGVSGVGRVGFRNSAAARRAHVFIPWFSASATFTYVPSPSR